MPNRHALLLLLASVGLCSTSFAATTDTPRAHVEIQKHGAEFPGTQYLELRAVYEPYLRDAGFEKSKVTRDVSYGPHERLRLDVLEPTRANAGDELMPVVVFVHGGGFVSGAKGGADGSEIFDNVLNYFTRHDMLGINVNYRLAPEHTYPAAADDLRGVMRRLHQHAADYGGDPQSIFIVGHSAGAVHVATYALTEELQFNEGNDGLRGAILMSGTYGALGTSGSEHVYFGEGAVRVAERMPFAQLPGRKVPLFIVDAEFDPLRMQREAIALVDALCERDGKCPRHQQVAGHNHYSLMYHINTVDDSIAASLVDFVRQHAGN